MDVCVCVLTLGVSSAGSTRQGFLSLNEILTKLSQRSFAFHGLGYKG